MRDGISFQRIAALQVCGICGTICKGGKGLGSHVSRAHPITLKQYYDEYLKGPGDGVCPICGKEPTYINLVQGYRKYCCPKCSFMSEDRAARISETNKRTKALHPENVIGPWKGKSLPEEVKGRIRKKAIENRKAMSPEQIEENQRKATENLHKAIPDMSARQTKLMNEGKIGVKGWYFSKKNNENLFYRSTYELSAFQILEQMTAVARFTCRPEPIKYEFEGSRHRYLPDILVEYHDGQIEVIEVKAQCFMNDPRNQAKFRAAQKWCAERRFKFCIWTERNEPRLLQNSVTA